ncbi:MAG TPA: enoyl-ACP reductase FabV [Candidatus Acidoferrales bacterium]|nr:enoyl-ACP reductase FabV [Candidatus Acidoferrales bacterium]
MSSALCENLEERNFDMPLQVIQRRSRGFICLNAHPAGCRRNVQEQIRAIASGHNQQSGPSKALIVGASTGYGLASRIAAAWAFGAKTVGVFLERPAEGNKTASAGFYNTVAFHEFARNDGLLAASVNGDAFSSETKRIAGEMVRKQLGKIDLLIYSVAAPKRVDTSGVAHSSVLRPIGSPYTNKTVELDSEKVTGITIPPANDQQIADTVAVMGGADWKLWVDMLEEQELIGGNFRTLAYSYIGPELTWPIYRDGTIGRAKKDLEETARALDATLRHKFGGAARIAVNKAIVTQASAAIPVVPLYMSLLFRVMKQKNLHEGAIQQMRRLFFDFLASDSKPLFDSQGRIRLDDREMLPEVQSQVSALWPRVDTSNLRQLTDFAGFQHDFRALFGFEIEGVDYAEPVETALSWQ